MLANFYFEEPMASQLEAMREKARARHYRITYDCFSAVVNKDKVTCKKGHRLERGSMGLLSVLRGRTSKVCQTCPYYDGDDTEDEIKPIKPISRLPKWARG